MKRVLYFVLAVIVLALPAVAQENALPTIDDGAAKQSTAAEELSGPVQIVLVLTALAMAPAILMTVTSFTRIVIVLSFVRKALGVQDMPPNQIVIGMALFLTLATMRPVLDDVWKSGVKPYLDDEITLSDAADRSAVHLHTFLRRHAQEDEVKLFLSITQAETPAQPEDVPLTVLVPAFALSELKVAFKMGFLIFIPFLVVDIVVSSILLAMGMMMLPPVIISTPFKILLFIMVDGWSLVIASLMESFQIAA